MDKRGPATPDAVSSLVERQYARIRRLERLQEATARLAGALTEEDVANTLLSVTEDVLRAAAGVVYLTDAAGNLTLRAARGVTPSVQRWAILPRDARVPLAMAIAGAKPVFVRTHADLARQYPKLQPSDMPVDKLQSLAALPLVHAGRVLGGFAVSFDDAQVFDEEEQRWLSNIGTQAALAADRARLFESEKRARAEAETLFRVAESISATPMELGSIVQRVTDEATRLVGAELGAFFYNMQDRNGQSHLLYTLSGAPKESFDKLGLPHNTPLFAATLSGQAVVRLNDVREDPRYGQVAPHHGLPKGHLPIVSYLAAPVVSRSGQVLGGLFFGHSQPARFTVEHERLTTSLAATAALAVDNAKLYQGSREVGETNRRLVDDLSETVRLNQLYMGVLAHDLGAPLTAVLSSAETILARASDARDRKAADRIAISGQRMQRMIDQLLDFTRLRVGQGLTLDPQPADLTALARQVIDEFEQAHPGRVFTLEEAGDLGGRWDADRLGQVISNLVGNAVQHGAADAAVSVRLDGTDPAAVTLTVANQGTIAADRLPALFEPLKLDNARRRKGSGVGLGLFITRQIALAHGGDVRVTSSETDGTTITVTLPRAQARPTRARTRTAGKARNTERTLAIAGEQVRESEARFRLLVDAVKDYAIYMLDPDGRVMIWNSAAH